MDYLDRLVDYCYEVGAQQMIDEVKFHKDFEVYKKLIVAERFYYNPKSKIYQLKVEFHSPYLAARVIGKHGECIKKIQKLTSTKIDSPNHGYITSFDSLIFRDNSFSIRSSVKNDVYFAHALIVLTGLFFSKKYDDLITPKYNEVSEKINVMPYLVPNLLKNNGAKIKNIRLKTGVRIVSPKPYATPCTFHLIGEPDAVELALNMFSNLIWLSNLEANLNNY